MVKLIEPRFRASSNWQILAEKLVLSCKNKISTSQIYTEQRPQEIHDALPKRSKEWLQRII